MENIEKALRDLEKAVNGNQTVSKVKVTITLQKPKTQQGKNPSRKQIAFGAGGRWETATPRPPNYTTENNGTQEVKYVRKKKNYYIYRGQSKIQRQNLEEEREKVRALLNK